MPNVLPGYVPSSTALPIFLVRLAKEASFEYEYDCISGIVTELAMLYAITHEDEQVHEMEGWLRDAVRDLVVPAMKADSFLPSATLVRDGAVRSIATVRNMFTVFERS